jgi:hypothetical protein
MSAATAPCLHRIEETGHIETAYRVLQLISSIFEYAVAEEICEHSRCQGLSKTLSARPTRHHASITDPKQLGELLRAIEATAVHSASLICFRVAELAVLGKTTTEPTQPSEKLFSARTLLDL